MPPDSAGMQGGPGWERLKSDMKVVTLTPTLRLAVPALALATVSKKTRGLTLPPGKTGLGVGALLLGSSLVVGFLLLGATGPLGALLSFWLMGTAGVATIAASRSPMAFVKGICVGCRLLPIIKEHEAIHLSGVASETRVWDMMKMRHSTQSLALEGDPAICTFCPIPKRLSEVHEP